MTQSPAQTALLAAALELHRSTPALLDFAPVPSDLSWQSVTPHHIPSSDLLQNDATLTPIPSTAALHSAFIAAAPEAQWRETYKHSRIDPDFIARFGCYQLIGSGGFFTCPDFSSYVVYMPPGLHYPEHQHPAEELYYILSGSADFSMGQGATHCQTPGSAIFYSSNVPHVTTTRDSGVLAYVLWRGDLSTKPIWSDPRLRDPS